MLSSILMGGKATLVTCFLGGFTACLEGAVGVASVLFSFVTTRHQSLGQVNLQRRCFHRSCGLHGRLQQQ